jgi:hypothetical protein
MNKNVNSIRFKEWGDNLVFINSDLLEKIENILINLDSLNPLELNDFETLNYIDIVKSQYYIASDLSGLLRFLNKLNYITKDYKELADFIDIAVNKNYAKLVEKFFNNEYSKLDYEKDLDLNILNSLIFVVKDLDKFIEAVSNKGYSISTILINKYYLLINDT